VTSFPVRDAAGDVTSDSTTSHHLQKYDFGCPYILFKSLPIFQTFTGFHDDLIILFCINMHPMLNEDITAMIVVS
jgi:hypothetical protein